MASKIVFSGYLKFGHPEILAPNDSPEAIWCLKITLSVKKGPSWLFETAYSITMVLEYKLCSWWISFLKLFIFGLFILSLGSAFSCWKPFYYMEARDKFPRWQKKTENWLFCLQRKDLSPKGSKSLLWLLSIEINFVHKHFLKKKQFQNIFFCFQFKRKIILSGIFTIKNLIIFKLKT